MYQNHAYRSQVQISIDDQLFWRSFIILKKWFIGCGRTSTADPAPGRSFSSRGYRVAVGQCGSLVLPSPGGGGVGQKLKVDIVGRWGRVAPMKKKIIRSQERWGRVSWTGTASSSHSQFVLDLSFLRSASQAKQVKREAKYEDTRGDVRSREEKDLRLILETIDSRRSSNT